MTEVFQRVFEVGPNEKGEGSSMTLLWDGEERAIAIANFDGSDVTVDITPDRLLADLEELQEQACNGELQVVFRDEALIDQLKREANIA